MGLAMDNNERLVKAESRIEQHEERIDQLQLKTDNMHMDLQELKNLLNSIKWWLYGIGTFYIISEVGMTHALKKYLGI